VPPELIKEVILQSAIYCGIPAANSAFEWAREMLTIADIPRFLGCAKNRD
jgi:4-carboxymuconolactone decarboxylase